LGDGSVPKEVVVPHVYRITPHESRGDTHRMPSVRNDASHPPKEEEEEEEASQEINNNKIEKTTSSVSSQKHKQLKVNRRFFFYIFSCAN